MSGLTHSLFCRLVTMFCASLVSFSSHAHSYEHSTSAPFFLGGGINPLKLDEGLANCIKTSVKMALDGPGVSRASVVLKAVKSRKELFSTLGASAAVSAQGFFGSGSLSADYLEQNDFFDDSLTWVVLARTEFGRVALSGPELLPKFQKMIDENRHAEFAATCGTHYIAQQSMGASVFAIYTLRNLSQSQKSRIEALLSAQASFTPRFSGSLEGEFNKVLTQAARSSQMSCHAYAVGGDGINQLSGLIGAYSTDIGRVQRIIEEYVAHLVPEKAAPLRYQAVSMREFGFNEVGSIEFQKRDDVLAQHYFLIREGQDLSTRLYGLIFKGGSATIKLGPEQLAEYRNAHEIITKDLERLHENAMRCYEDARACSYPKANWPVIQWPESEAEQCIDLSMPSRIYDMTHPAHIGWYQKFSKEQCGRTNDEELANNCINEREAAELKLLGAVPLCMNSKFVTWCFC